MKTHWQPDLFAAMEEGRDGQWIQDAVMVIYALALTRPELTSQDVRDQMSVEPWEPRAMGAAMREGKRRGMIRSTSHYVPLGSHGRPIRVWKSLVYRAVA